MNEIYFEWWLKELQSINLVHSFEYEPQFVLCDPLVIFYDHIYKRKDPIIKNFNLLNAITYKPDYKVVFDRKLINKLFGVFFTEEKKLLHDPNLSSGNVYQNTLFYASEKGLSFLGDSAQITTVEVYFDVKPPPVALKFSGALGSSRDFKFNQRLMLEQHGIFVNKVVPSQGANCLYNKTFVPRRFLFTDGGGMTRKKKKHLKYTTMERYLIEKQIV